MVDSPVTLSADGSAVPAAPTDGLLGKVLDRRYRLDAVVGEGAMGVVFRATHVLIDKPMAVKVLRRVAPVLLRRFLKEARVASRIDHPNVVHLSDCGELPGGGAYFVMELLKGEPLSDTIARERRIEPQRALGLVGQIVAGMKAAHAAGVVHRDLKPENVFLCAGERPESEVVKLLDFGVARADGSTDTLPGSVFGTPEYMAPEQARGDAIDQRADLYALGVMMFEMLVGRVPLYAGDIAELIRLKLHTAAPRISVAVPGLPIAPELDDLVASLLALSPSDRPDDAVAVEAALARVSSAAAPPSGASGAAGRLTIEMGSGSTDALAQAAASPGPWSRDRPDGWRAPIPPRQVGPPPDRQAGQRPGIVPGVTVPQSRQGWAGAAQNPAPTGTKTGRTIVVQDGSGASVHPPVEQARASGSAVAAIRAQQHGSQIGPVPSRGARAPIRSQPRAAWAAQSSHALPQATAEPSPSAARPTSTNSSALSIGLAMLAAAATAAAVTFGVSRVVPARTVEGSATAADPTADRAAVGEGSAPDPQRPAVPPADIGLKPTPTPKAGTEPSAVGLRDAEPPPTLNPSLDPSLNPSPSLARSQNTAGVHAGEAAEPAAKPPAARPRPISPRPKTTAKPVPTPTPTAKPPRPPGEGPTAAPHSPTSRSPTTTAPVSEPGAGPGESKGSPPVARPTHDDGVYDLKDPFSGN